VAALLGAALAVQLCQQQMHDLIGIMRLCGVVLGTGGSCGPTVRAACQRQRLLQAVLTVAFSK